MEQKIVLLQNLAQNIQLNGLSANSTPRTQKIESMIEKLLQEISTISTQQQQQQQQPSLRVRTRSQKKEEEEEEYQCSSLNNNKLSCKRRMLPSLYSEDDEQEISDYSTEKSRNATTISSSSNKQTPTLFSAIMRPNLHRSQEQSASSIPSIYATESEEESSEGWEGNSSTQHNHHNNNILTQLQKQQQININNINKTQRLNESNNNKTNIVKAQLKKDAISDELQAFFTKKAKMITHLSNDEQIKPSKVYTIFNRELFKYDYLKKCISAEQMNKVYDRDAIQNIHKEIYHSWSSLTGEQQKYYIQNAKLLSKKIQKNQLSEEEMNAYKVYFKIRGKNRTQHIKTCVGFHELIDQVENSNDFTNFIIRLAKDYESRSVSQQLSQSDCEQEEDESKSQQKQQKQQQQSEKDSKKRRRVLPPSDFEVIRKRKQQQQQVQLNISEQSLEKQIQQINTELEMKNEQVNYMDMFSFIDTEFLSEKSLLKDEHYY